MLSKANGCWPVAVVVGMLAFASTSASALACDSAPCGRIVVAENTASRTAAEPAATKPSHHAKHHAHHSSHSEKHAAKPPAPDQKADAADRKINGKDDAALPATVADAQAQMTGTDAGALANGATPPVALSAAAPNTATAQSPATDASPSQGSDTTVVAAAQLNDVDATAAPDKPTGKILHPVPETPHLANAGSEDAWSQTSLLGKVFIVLGGCLTLASAARMFIA